MPYVWRMLHSLQVKESFVEAPNEQQLVKSGGVRSVVRQHFLTLSMISLFPCGNLSLHPRTHLCATLLST